MSTTQQSTYVFEPSALTEFATAVLASAGVAESDARIVAESLVDADLRGVHSHGVNRLGIYVQRLREGGNDPGGEVEVIAQAASLTLLDAGNVLGQVASARAVEIALEQAAKTGCSVVSVRNGSHFGAAGYWTRKAAEAGCLSIASTNGSSLMVPFGSSMRALGTNPISFAFPSSKLDPVVVDFATSEATWGALVNANAAGEQIPTTWALDEDGNPTSDAGVAIASRRLLPFGRHKGSALAVAVEMLTAALSGASALSAIPDMYAEPEKPNELGFFFLAIDPRALGASGEGVPEAVAAIQAEINALPPAGDAKRVYWPGQIEAERAAERRASGIPMPGSIVGELQTLAADVGVELRLP